MVGEVALVQDFIRLLQIMNFKEIGCEDVN
jgi:hypothetical protein